MDREPATREAVIQAEDAYRSALAALGAHDLGRPELTTVTPQGVAALRSHRALSVAVAGGVRRGRNMRRWLIARRALRAACATAEQAWEDALRAAEGLQADVTTARLVLDDRAMALSRLTVEMEPLAAVVAAARQRWGDCVPVGPSQAETEDPALIEWRETSAPWADAEYAKARAEAFIAALELHKALIVAQADVFEANLAALMELIAAGAAAQGTDSDLAGLRLAAWRSFFLVVPAVHVAFDAAGSLFDGLGSDSLGWLLAAGADQLSADDVPRLLDCFHRAVFAGDTVLAPPRPEIAETIGIAVPAQATAQDLADRVVRYGTWLPAGPPSGPRHARSPTGSACRCAWSAARTAPPSTAGTTSPTTASSSPTAISFSRPGRIASMSKFQAAAAKIRPSSRAARDPGRATLPPPHLHSEPQPPRRGGPQPSLHCFPPTVTTDRGALASETTRTPGANARGPGRHSPPARRQGPGRTPPPPLTPGRGCKGVLVEAGVASLPGDPSGVIEQGQPPFRPVGAHRALARGRVPGAGRR